MQILDSNIFLAVMLLFISYRGSALNSKVSVDYVWGREEGVRCIRSVEYTTQGGRGI